MQIEQIDRDAAAELFNDVLPAVGSFAEWGYSSDRAYALDTMSDAFARHRLAALSARPADSDMVERADFREKLDTYLIDAGLHHRVTLDDALGIVRAAIAAITGGSHG